MREKITVDVTPRWVDMVEVWRQLDKRVADCGVFSEIKRMAEFVDKSNEQATKKKGVLDFIEREISIFKEHHKDQCDGTARVAMNSLERIKDMVEEI